MNPANFKVVQSLRRRSRLVKTEPEIYIILADSITMVMKNHMRTCGQAGDNYCISTLNFE